MWLTSMNDKMVWPAVVIVGLGVWQLGRPAAAQEPSGHSAYADAAGYAGPRNISGLASGYEAWQLGEIRRRAAIGMQFDLEGDMYWRWGGVSSYYPGIFEPWPMVPGNIWGWPAAVGPPRMSPTQFAPPIETEASKSAPSGTTVRRAAAKVARISTGRISGGAVAQPDKFVPGLDVEAAHPRRVYPGPREF